MRRTFTALLGVLLLTVTAPAAAPAPLLPAAPTLADVARDPLAGGALAGDLALAARGSATGLLQALLRAQGHEDAPVAHGPAPVPGAPAHVAEPLARLLGAVAAAEALRAQALAGLTPAEQAQALGLLAHAPAPAFAAVEGSGVRLSAGALDADPAAAALAARVDAPAFRAAALTLLQAIEDSAPALRAAALLEPQADVLPAACPGVTGLHSALANCAVIVGNTGPNAYAPPAAPVLLVDLGGNDLYTIPAGVGAGSVQVLVDVAGADTYAHAASAFGPGAIAAPSAQGVGTLGVGVLADLGGSDTYAASASTGAPQPGGAAGEARLLAQGVANLGAGVLLDLGGVDRFTATAASSGGSGVVVAQGAGSVGLGALLSLGNDAGADDAYLAHAASALHHESSSGSTNTYTIGPAHTYAQAGAALGAAAVLADAGGNDAYTALATGGLTGATAQGAVGNANPAGGLAAGAALLLDALGDDTMVTRALGDATLSLVTADPSFCWTVTVTVNLAGTLNRALAHGAAVTGAAALVDLAGSDARTLESVASATAHAQATSNHDCSSFGGNKAIATANSGTGLAQGQGSGVTAGVGLLLDAMGNDRNALRGESRAIARALATSPGPDVETPSASAGAGSTSGQGFASVGAGLALDLGGADQYHSVADSTATQTTTAGSALAVGVRTQAVQGSGATGAGWLLDVGGVDAYTTSPAASAAANDSCWSNGGQGRGRDWLSAGLGPLPCV